MPNEVNRGTAGEDAGITGVSVLSRVELGRHVRPLTARAIEAQLVGVGIPNPAGGCPTRAARSQVTPAGMRPLSSALPPASTSSCSA